MESNKKSPIMRFMGNLHYFHKFAVISILFGLAISLSLYFLAEPQLKTLGTTHLELDGVRYQRAVEKVLEGIIKHRTLTSAYIRGDNGVKGEIITLQSQINADFKNLMNLDDRLQKTLETHTQGFNDANTSNINPEELERKWEAINRQSLEYSLEESNGQHLSLITDLYRLIAYVGDTSGLYLDDNPGIYYLVIGTLKLLPEGQFLIPKINVASYNAALSDDISDSILFSELVTQLRLNLEETRDTLNKSYRTQSERDEDTGNSLREPLRKYVSVTGDYLGIIYDSLLDGVELNFQEVTSLGDKSLNDNFALWYAASDQLNALLEKRVSSIKWSLFMHISTILGLGIGAFLFGIHVLARAMSPIYEVMEATRELADGNLSVRVPVYYNDTIGQLSQSINKVAESFQELIGQLQWTGIQLTTSTTEIAAAAKQQEATVIQQESTTKEIAVTAREISATAKDFAKTMSEVSTTAEETSAIASSGKNALEQMQTIMQQLVEASSQIASKLGALNEKAGTITGVVTTITKVADQTNLLSLNAAIEAEKAGEHGRSFAVIAREIRRLADQTANATYDIEKMVTEMVSAVSGSVMGVDKFSAEINNAVEQVNTVSEHLTQIMEQVQQQTSSYESVNQGMQAQSLGAEQINESIIQLSEVAQQTSESIRQFHRAIEQLNNAAQEMQSSVVKLKK